MTHTEHRPPTLQERVTARYESLTATERKVASYLSDHPQLAAFASAEEIARATGTSDASVVRTAKALGFDGLPGLKRTLQEHLSTLLSPTHLLRNTMDTFHDGPEGVLATMLADRAEMLEVTRRAIDPAAFRRAVELLTAARETLVWGLGGDASLVEYTVTRLIRIGHAARPASDTGFRLADRLLTLGSDDLVLAIAHGQIRPELRVTLDHAADVGARVVLLTDALGEALRDRTEVALSAPTSQPGMYGGQSMILIILEALTMAVAAQDPNRAVAAFNKRNELREGINALIAANAAGGGKRRR